MNTLETWTIHDGSYWFRWWWWLSNFKATGPPFLELIIKLFRHCWKLKVRWLGLGLGMQRTFRYRVFEPPCMPRPKCWHPKSKKESPQRRDIINSLRSLLEYDCGNTIRWGVNTSSYQRWTGIILFKDFVFFYLFVLLLRGTMLFLLFSCEYFNGWLLVVFIQTSDTFLDVSKID